MYEEFGNPERYRITGRVPGTDEHPDFTFESDIFVVYMPEDLEMVKQAAKDFATFFGLNSYQVNVSKTRDKWESVRFDD